MTPSNKEDRNVKRSDPDLLCWLKMLGPQIWDLVGLGLRCQASHVTRTERMISNLYTRFCGIGQELHCEQGRSRNAPPIVNDRMHMKLVCTNVSPTQGSQQYRACKREETYCITRVWFIRCINGLGQRQLVLCRTHKTYWGFLPVALCNSSSCH